MENDMIALDYFTDVRGYHMGRHVLFPDPADEAEIVEGILKKATVEYNSEPSPDGHEHKMFFEFADGRKMGFGFTYRS